MSRFFAHGQRAALYVHAGGKCTYCGCPLEISWHADHTTPYGRGGTTSLPNGQALCPQCNRKKGDRQPVSTARPFQQRFHDVLKHRLLRLAHAANRGQVPTLIEKTITCDIHPGSGKTLMSLLGGNEAFLQQFVDAIAMFVPRINLCEQTELAWNAYTKTSSERLAMGRVCHVSNDPPLLRRHNRQSGYISTYQSLVSCPELHQQVFQEHRGRIMLVLDEAHILGYNSVLENGTQAAREILRLAESAAVIILMTGTPYRSDGEPLILANYSDPDADGIKYLQPDVEASYLEGVTEGYLRPFEAEMFDAKVTLEDLLSKETRHIVVSEAERQLGIVMRDERFYAPLIDRAVEKIGELKGIRPEFCGLVGCADQQHAREVMRYLERVHPNINALIAISDDREARDNLAKFKRGRHHLLITCAMAHVGYDHKPISVVCCLTAIRDEAWLRQFFARGMRMIETGDPGMNDAQRLFLLAPDDPKMSAIINRMRDESLQGLAQREVRTQSLEQLERTASASFVVNTIEHTDMRAVGLDPANDVGADEFRRLDALRKRHKVGAVPLTALHAIIQEATAKLPLGVDSFHALPSDQTAHQIESDLRGQISKLQKAADSLLGAPVQVSWGYTYLAIEKHLGHKPSGDEDCREALAWLKSSWLPQCRKHSEKQNAKS